MWISSDERCQFSDFSATSKLGRGHGVSYDGRVTTGCLGAYKLLAALSGLSLKSFLLVDHRTDLTKNARYHRICRL